MTAPVFVTDLTNLAPWPSTTRQVVFVDGYSSVGDGGQGTFYWDPNFTGTPNPYIDIRPTGSGTGAWRREIQGELTAAMFGAVGDGNAISALPTGTDDSAALQAMFDSIPVVPVDDRSGRNCRLNVTKHKSAAGLVGPFTGYRIKKPIQVNEGINNSVTTVLGDSPSQQPSVGIIYEDYIGPAIVAGACGYVSDSPSYVNDPAGSGLPMILAGQQTVSTTIAIGSNGVALPTSTINVASTQAFAYAGKIAVTSRIGGLGGSALINYWVSYTGKTSTSFTGCTGGTGTLQTGDTVYPPWCPHWSISDTRLGDLTGVGAFTIEMWVNPGDSTAWMNATYPAAFVSSWFGSGGQTGNVEAAHDSFYFVDSNPSARQFVFVLKTTGSTYTLQTSSTVDQTFPAANSLTSIIIQWDGTNLDMWINGSRPSASGAVCHLTTTGTLAQTDYESFTILAGLARDWPYRGGTGLFQPCAAGMAFGPFRFSTVARYTSGATITVPNPATLTTDANTRIRFAFDSAHVPSRVGMLGYTIAETMQTYGGQAAPMNVWLKNYTNQVPYQHNIVIKDLLFAGFGEGIHTFSAVCSEVGERCMFLASDQAIIMDDYSYNSGIGPRCQTVDVGLGTATHKFLSCEVLMGHGDQFMYIREGFQSSSNTNYGVVSTFADITIGPRFPNAYKKAGYAFVQSCGANYLNGASLLDDQSGGYGLCGVLFCPEGGPNVAHLLWNGGYIGMTNSTTPVVLIGNADTSPAPVEINTQIFGTGTNAIFSFRGTADGSQAVLWGGSNPNATPLIDTSNSGPVMDKRRATHGRQSIAVTGNMTLDAKTQIFYGYTLFAGSLGAAATITQPCHIVGRRFRVRNTTGQSITYQANTGTGVSIANNTTVDLYDDGTNIVTQ